MLDTASEDAFLVFGVPESDDVGVSFWCRIGSNRIKIFFPEGSSDLPPNTEAEFVVTTGTKQHSLKGKTSENTITGVTSVETEVELTDPLINDLKLADRFVARIGHHELTYPLVDSGLEDLTKLCHSRN